ncbi:MAG: NAD(P)/FAD-dependent oxidoreductase [Gammaproteobacteria bacterium]|nr:NAD(P)/FAD-dependent oxidoreductase [Gammaproteobacteria bacterium]
MVRQFDVVIIGAGISGLYALHRFRQLGMSVRVVDAAQDVGGTWYWNRYPGARFDSESYSYQYSFSRELIDEWNWSEHFAGQPEIERYLQYVADKFDLRRDIDFGARVRSVVYDQDSARWTVHTENGLELGARYVVAATGFLSAHQMPDIAGLDSFAGVSTHTARWPKAGIELRGKRVGVIGSGATAVQVIQTIAPEVGHLSVFQHSPNWCTALRNRPIDADTQRELKARAYEIFDQCNQTYAGFIHQLDMRPASDFSREERFRFYEALHAHGGFALWLANYADVFRKREIAQEVSEFLAAKIRERVKDPAIAEKLIPKDHLFSTKRPPGETNYFEAYNHPHVELVDLRETPIDRIAPQGVITRHGEETRLHELDVLIYATGFRAVTGELMRMDIVGEGGLTLKDKWADGPKTNLGVQFAGFPNFFAILGPHNPAAFCNITRCAENNVDWVVNCIQYLQQHGYTSIQPEPAAEEAWTQRCYDSVKGLLFGEITDSWFFGYHNPGGDHGRYLIFTEGVPAYRRIFADVAASGYAGFTMR